MSAQAEWAEFSDGGGRLLRLGVEGQLAREERAMLSLLLMTAALSLEIAVLRSVGERSGPAAREQAVPEIQASSRRPPSCASCSRSWSGCRLRARP